MSKCKITLFSNVGNSRENQEDNALLVGGRYLSSSEIAEISFARKSFSYFCECDQNEDFMAAVSDGMGGHASGEIASGRTVKYLSENYRKIIDGAYLNEKFISDEISRLNRDVVAFSKSNSGYRGMGATLCGVIRSKGAYYGFNVGDSRMYFYSNGVLEQLSEDHTEGQRLRKLNLLTEDELKRFPRRKNLYKYVGVGGDLIPDVFTIDNCVPGSTLMICSDGVSDVINKNEIEEVLGRSDSSKEKGNLLVNEALKRNIGYGDNITLLLIEF